VSTLERLYQYAKATGAGALENFATEALAGRGPPEPATGDQRAQGAPLLPPDDVTELEVDTQVAVPGAATS
jgi:hypothetical protein